MLRVWPAQGAPRSAESSSSFLKVDPRKKQVTLYDPAAGPPGSAGSRLAATTSVPKMFAFDAVFPPDSEQVRGRVPWGHRRGVGRWGLGVGEPGAGGLGVSLPHRPPPHPRVSAWARPGSQVSFGAGGALRPGCVSGPGKPSVSHGCGTVRVPGSCGVCEGSVTGVCVARACQRVCGWFVRVSCTFMSYPCVFRVHVEISVSLVLATL